MTHRDKMVTVFLSSAIVLCFCLSLTFLSAAGLQVPVVGTTASASETSTVIVSYTPKYTTQYAVSAPSDLTLSPDGSATSMTISLSSWSDFPTDKSLYCELSSVSALTSGSNSVDMVVKNGATTVEAGDQIATFRPSSMASDTSADVAVLTVEPSEKPSVSGTYRGTIGIEVGLVE